MKRRARSRAGYTMVELMMALTLFTIAVLGSMSLQKITAVSNSHAKNLALAQRIAQSWATQLELDATTWNVGLTGSNWLGGVGAGWVRPNYAAGPAFGAAFDALGNPLSDTDADLRRAQFCSHVRLSWLYPDNVPVSGNGLMRAEIRVFWLRDGEGLPNPALTLCDRSVATGTVTTNADSFHFVYQAGGLRQHSSI